MSSLQYKSVARAEPLKLRRARKCSSDESDDISDFQASDELSLQELARLADDTDFRIEEVTECVVQLANSSWKRRIEDCPAFKRIDLYSILKGLIMSSLNSEIPINSLFILGSVMRRLQPPNLQAFFDESMFSFLSANFCTPNEDLSSEVSFFLISFCSISQESRDFTLSFFPISRIVGCLSAASGEKLKMRLCELLRNLSFFPLSQEDRALVLGSEAKMLFKASEAIISPIAQNFYYILQQKELTEEETNLMNDSVPAFILAGSKHAQKAAICILRTLLAVTTDFSFLHLELLPPLIKSAFPSVSREASETITLSLKVFPESIELFLRNGLVHYIKKCLLLSAQAKSNSLSLLLSVSEASDSEEIDHIIREGILSQLDPLFEIEEADTTLTVLKILSFIFKGGCRRPKLPPELPDHISTLMNSESEEISQLASFVYSILPDEDSISSDGIDILAEEESEETRAEVSNAGYVKE